MCNICSVCKEEYEDKYFDKEQNKCILHCEKDNWFIIDVEGNKDWSSSNAKIKFFWIKIRKKLNEYYSSDFYEYYIEDFVLVYDSVIFPQFQKDVKYIKGLFNIEEQGSNFYYFGEIEHQQKVELTLNNIIDDLSIKFNCCTFLDELNLEKYKFKKQVTFSKCKFNKEIRLSEYVNYELLLDRCSFSSDLSVNDVEFKKEVTINAPKNLKDVNFKRCVFNNKLNLYLVENLNSLFLHYSKFNDMLVIRGFDSQINNFQLILTTLNNFLILESLKIFNKVDLTRTIFANKINLINSSLEVENRETAQIIKDSFEQQNNIIEANKFYALEMKEREKELDWKKDFVDWIVFKFHGLSSNHSQDWLLSLLWIILFGMLATLFKIDFDTKINFIFLVIPILYLWIEKYMFFVFYVLYFLFLKTLFIYKPLDELANNINPFSIMTGKENLTFGTLIFKIIIAYLIYQFIISIRQNTRRK